MKYVNILFFLIVAKSNGAIEYDLNLYSEEYNIQYVLASNFSNVSSDSVFYVIPNDFLQDGFVFELGALNNGEKSCLVFNDSLDFVISKNDGQYTIDTWSSEFIEDERKISLYFVNGIVKVYIDEEKQYMFPWPYDEKKRVGIRWRKNNEFHYSFLNCFIPIPFKYVDYGSISDSVNLNKNFGKFQNVNEKYSIVYSKDVVANSRRSLRFEYRYSDSQQKMKNKTQRARSELSGVVASSLMNKWIIEFDLFIPESTKDDSLYREIITQLHEGSEFPRSPAISLGMLNGFLYVNVHGDSSLIKDDRKIDYKEGKKLELLTYLEKNIWHHIKLYVREAYTKAFMPVTKIWVDGKEVFDDDTPNCYNYKKKKKMYSYLKFGIYKWNWLHHRPVQGTESRVYYFDNYVVGY